VPDLRWLGDERKYRTQGQSMTTDLKLASSALCDIRSAKTQCEGPLIYYDPGIAMFLAGMAKAREIDAQICEALGNGPDGSSEGYEFNCADAIRSQETKS
jgi:hypothetical protein